MPRPILASISLSALRHNLGAVRRHAPRSRVWAVIKANGYGHGVARVSAALDAADGYALLELEQAVRLREAGCAKPILLLEGMFSAADLEPVGRHAFELVVHDLEQVLMLERARLSAPVAVWLKINTGMNRLGFVPGKVRGAYDRLRASANVGSIALMTHFADADGAGGITAQMAQFKACTSGLSAQVTLANSAAILRYPQTHADWVRPGIMLYGCSPFSDISAQTLGLRPVMTLASEIIAIQNLHAGDSVGYGAAYTAPQDLRMGVVACGYADGYPRLAPAGSDRGAPVLVAGVRTRTLGRVSMDMLCVDLSAVPQARVGSPVVLWGEGLSADEVAASAGTISYELLCALAPRVRQVDVD